MTKTLLQLFRLREANKTASVFPCFKCQSLVNNRHSVSKKAAFTCGRCFLLVCGGSLDVVGDGAAPASAAAAAEHTRRAPNDNVCAVLSASTDSLNPKIFARAKANLNRTTH